MGTWFAKHFKKKDYNILIIGLENAGKSSIVQRLMKKDGELEQTVPTIGSQVKEVTFNKLHMVLWDVGGQKDQRNTWKHYYVGTNALVFVVDSADSSKFEESSKEFSKVIEDQYISGIPCLILGNKSDLEGAADEAELTTYFDILKYGKERKISFRMQICSALTGKGLQEGFTWLSDNMPK